MKPVLLINTNVVQPPVSPVGLEYVGEALREASVPVRVLDLAFESNWKPALARELRDEPLMAAVSVRNTDDCCFATRRSFIPWIAEVAAEVRRVSRTFVLLGGVGFSVMPEAVLQFTGADAGVAGDGEESVAALARCLNRKEDFSRLPNLVYRAGSRIIANPRKFADTRQYPLPRRRLFDNARYQQIGAIVGIETKRGCASGCIYCADPIAKGRRVRLRPPEVVVREFRELLNQGVSWFHLADSEFNQPISHAKAVCRAIIDAGLGGRIKWYTYASPQPFDAELAVLMKRAGCAGINFGVDSLCDDQLARLGRPYRFDDIGNLAALLKQERINYIFDLLVGGPGETEATAAETIERVKSLDVPLAGIACGLRVYPGTALAQSISGDLINRGLHVAPGAAHLPSFYLSPALGEDASGLVKRLAAGDPRFMLLVSPEEKASYNYAGDMALSQRIKAGARGAYWDILSRYREDSCQPNRS